VPAQADPKIRDAIWRLGMLISERYRSWNFLSGANNPARL
jgi:hypothetical protein